MLFPQIQKIQLQTKLQKAKNVIMQAFDEFDHERLSIAWTGGKDSTVLLWIIREICLEKNLPLPKIVFIDEGDVFPEIITFSKKLISLWNLEVDFVQNSDVMKQVRKLGDTVIVKKLSKENQKEISLLGETTTKFAFEPESLIGNHLMKTVALRKYLKKHKISALFTGIRKDEQEARSQETYFSERLDPPHVRVHPILDFTEKNIWQAIHQNDIPFSVLYKKGYRSLGARSSTKKVSHLPAWEQDLKNTAEREGRRQDKEKIMEKLRKLGYM